MPTLAQKRAATAYHQVDAVATQEQYKKIRKEYGSLARGMAALIQVNGLGPGLAFLCAKSRGDSHKAHAVLYQHLSAWLSANVLPGADHSQTDFLQWIIAQNTATYQIATREALDFCIWLKRFAEARGLADDDPGGPA